MGLLQNKQTFEQTQNFFDDYFNSPEQLHELRFLDTYVCCC